MSKMTRKHGPHSLPEICLFFFTGPHFSSFCAYYRNVLTAGAFIPIIIVLFLFFVMFFFESAVFGQAQLCACVR
jgi:hypothetical protein